jgi:hypothetical protein
MNPAQTKANVERRLRDYARQSIPIERAHRDESTREKLLKFFSDPETALLKEPYLELLPRYSVGASLADLSEQGFIDPMTAKIFAEYFGSENKPERVRLYAHQVEAIRQACAHNKDLGGGRRGDGNLVVCSGTGSGKTESFLIPAIDYLVRQWRGETGGDPSKRLSKGVRAMVLYPMNALVNDQLNRIRRVLKNYSFLSFGRYTGETAYSSRLNSEVEENIDEIQRAFGASTLDSGQAISGVLRNEVVTRKQWKDAPAHILITNFSMLEYLLIRPETNFLFSNADGKHWKHIIIDEAHSYDGAMGAEIGWLIRRLQGRLTNKTQLRFIATSATLISDASLTPEAKSERICTNFASRIFPAPADSFQVLFGEERKTSIDEASNEREPGFYTTLASLAVPEPSLQSIEGILGNDEKSIIGSDSDWANLLDLSISTKAASQWCTKTLDLFQRFPEQDSQKPVSLADALELTMTALAAAKEKLTPNSVQEVHLSTGAFDHPNNRRSLHALAKLLFFGVGKFEDIDIWRKIMHDDADPRGSSVPTDVDDNDCRMQTGNKLHFLYNEWLHAFGASDDGSYDPIQPGNQNFGQLTLESMFWMLQVAHTTAVAVDQEFLGEDTELRPERLKIWFSCDTHRALGDFKKWLTALSDKLNRIEAAIASSWQEASLAAELPVVCADPDNALNPSEVIAAWFERDRKLSDLQEILKKSLRNYSDAKNATWASVRAGLFPGVSEPQADEELAALIRLASFAQPCGSREPLLDLRYHQVFRGLQGAGVQLQPLEQDEGTAWQLLPKSENTCELGACRQCGQAFLLAYANKQKSSALDSGSELQLLPFPGGDYEYLWALAWMKGERDEAEDEECEEETENLWYNTENLKIRKASRRPGAMWIRVLWLATPGNAEYPRFLQNCPNCGATRKPQDRTTASSYGLITPYELKSILRLVALDELSRNTDPSTDPVARCFPGQGRKVLAFSDSRSGASRLALQFQNFWLETALARLLPEVALALSSTPSIAGFATFCESLAAKLEENGARRVLEMTGKHGAELSPQDAAGVIILDALRRAGRNSVMRRGGLGLGLSTFNPQNANLPYARNASLQLLSEVLLFLFKQGQITAGPQNPWPRELVNRKTEWGADPKPVCKEKGAEGTISVVTSGQGTLNKLLSAELLQTTDAWVERIQQELGALDQRGNHELSALCRNVLQLDLNHLRSLVLSARFTKQKDIAAWEKCIQELGVHVRSDDPSNQLLKNAIRDAVIESAEYLLGRLWNQLVGSPMTPPSTRCLIPLGAGAGSQCYVLNPAPVQLLNFDEGTHETGLQGKPPFELEYWNQRFRNLVYLRIEEHTAQLASPAGASYQRAFGDGSINILSCSTTFEMGVDLGDLSLVFLANLPPSPASYRQRAGRAGRRPGSPAYVMTYSGESQHDRYYWDKPEELFFGKLSEPHIHLSNTVVRSRHLRAEALHHFLSHVQLPCDVELQPPGESGPESYSRRWQTLQDFLLGEIPGGVIKGNNAGRPGVVYKGRLSGSLVEDELVLWARTQGEALQNHLMSLSDVPADLGYSVAKDFVWQIKALSGPQKHEFAPYPLEVSNLSAFQKLGGPHLPEFSTNNSLLEDDHPSRRWRWTSLENQAKFIFQSRAERPPYYPRQPDGRALQFSQRNFLKERTLEWLAANRVLPKYGFPVDVVELMPHKWDSFAKRVELERDLKIGLFEYAPDEEVVADKRIYRSLRPGNYTVPGGQPFALVFDHFCDSCSQIFTGLDDGQPCPLCGGILREEAFCIPDFFQADRSTSGRMVQKPAPSKSHLFSGGTANLKSVPQTRLCTAESVSGFITYLNRGHGGRGYPTTGGVTGAQSYFLRHDVRTDIALWIPDSQLYNDLGWKNDLLQSGNGGAPVTRLQAAMKSALQALLGAIASVKQIKRGDIAGLVSPDPTNLQKGQYAFVLFDDSSGGSGAVLDLVLTGNEGPDEEARGQLIRSVLHAAIEVCNCDSCSIDLNQGKDPRLCPIPREDYLAKQTDEERRDFRVREACYDCLKSFANQREHTILDRHDAKRILQLLVTPEEGGGGLAAAVPVPGSDPGSDDGYRLLQPEESLPKGRIDAKVRASGAWLTGRCSLLAKADKEGSLLQVIVRMDSPSHEIVFSAEDWGKGGCIKVKP